MFISVFSGCTRHRDYRGRFNDSNSHDIIILFNGCVMFNARKVVAVVCENYSEASSGCVGTSL